MTVTQKQTRTDWPHIFLQSDFGLISIFSVLPDWVIVSHLLLWTESCAQLDPESVTCRFKSQRGRFPFGEITPTSMSARPTETWLFFKMHDISKCCWDIKLLKPPIIVLPILEMNPVFPDPCHTHGHTQRSQAHSAHLPLRCKWFVSTHHWPNAAPSPPLSSVYSCWTLSITAPPQSPCSALHFPLLFVVFSNFISLLPQEHSLKVFPQCQEK